MWKWNWSDVTISNRVLHLVRCAPWLMYSGAYVLQENSYLCRRNKKSKLPDTKHVFLLVDAPYRLWCNSWSRLKRKNLLFHSFGHLALRTNVQLAYYRCRDTYTHACTHTHMHTRAVFNLFQSLTDSLTGCKSFCTPRVCELSLHLRYEIAVRWWPPGACCHRNLSSAGEEARKQMRSCEGLVDSLLYVIKACVSTADFDSKVHTLLNISTHTHTHLLVL